MVKIRGGVMKDCSDLLTVYQGTHWDLGYKTVEEVKDIHRGVLFHKWGWLVAELKGSVIGEVIFRIEKSPLVGKIGIIRDLGVDVRYQKRTIGTKLTHAAEKVLKKKKAGQIVATTPPEAYNYWMKVKYFAKGKIIRLELPTSKVPQKKTTKVKAVQIKNITKIPKTMGFSHHAYPGSLAEIMNEIIDKGRKGLLFEYYSNDVLVGVGGIIQDDDKNGRFVADVTSKGEEFFDIVIARTARAASRWKSKKVYSVVPKTRVHFYTAFAKWKEQLEREIPVARIL